MIKHSLMTEIQMWQEVSHTANLGHSLVSRRVTKDWNSRHVASSHSLSTWNQSFTNLQISNLPTCTLRFTLTVSHKIRSEEYHSINLNNQFIQLTGNNRREMGSRTLTTICRFIFCTRTIIVSVTNSWHINTHSFGAVEMCWSANHRWSCCVRENDGLKG